MRHWTAFIFIGLLVAVAAIIIASSERLTRESSVRGTLNPQELHLELVKQLQEVGNDAGEASRIKRNIEALKRKAEKAYEKTENPEPFYAALAELKTTREGLVYPKHYKAKALLEAKRYHADLLKGSLRKSSGDEALPWIERGPGNVSGRAQAVIVDPDDATQNTWFVATIGGGIWKTTNGGVTWEHKTPDLTVYSTGAIVQAPSNPDVLYVGTGMGYGRVVELEGNGIWKSTDRGESWRQLASTANGELLAAINRIVIDPNDENVVLVCSNDSFSHFYPRRRERKSGIFRTIDGGETWTQVYDSDLALGTLTDNRVQQIIANPANFNTLYASVNEVGVIKSLNGGLDWSVSAATFALASDIGNPTSGGFGLAGISVRIELALAPTDTSRVYAAVERPRGIADLYMTKDAGDSWIRVDDSGNDPNWFNAFGTSGATGAYTAGWFDNTIAVHPFDHNVVFVGGVNLYRLDIDDSANTRTSNLSGFWLGGFGVPQVHADHHDLEIVPLDEATGSFRIINSNDGGLALSDDGGLNWTSIKGQNSTQFYGVDKKPGESVYIGGTQDNSTWHSGPDPGPTSSWVRDFGGDGFEAVWHYTNPNLVLGSSQNGGYQRSIDAALTWTAIPAGKAGIAPFISKIANNKSDPDLVFTIGNTGVNRSDDFGESWVLTPIQGNWLGYRPFDNIEVSLADPRVAWISSRLDIDPPAGIPGGIHVSTDGGLSFTEISINFPSSVREASGIGTHPTGSETAYFLFSAPGRPKILRTTDLGESWQDLSGFSGGTGTSSNGFPDVAVFSLLLMPFNTDVIWVGTEIGLFISEDGGASWRLANNGFPTVSVFEMKIVDDQVVVATYGRGIWSVTLPELAGYKPPITTLAPRLRPLTQDFSLGTSVFIPVDLRDSYDSTRVTVDGSAIVELPANGSPVDTVFTLIPTGSSPITVSVVSFKDGVAYGSAVRTFTPIQIAEAVSDFDLNFDSPFPNFSANGLSVATPTGFQSAAIHSPHPYPNGANMTFTFTQPFLLSDGQISYDEIVIAEPGAAGVTDHTNSNFFDFCVVEGSLDGNTWKALAPGYDSREDANWLATFTSGGAGTPALYKRRNITIPQNIFAVGDAIFLRFRLFADAGLSGWGWAIDNLQVQPDAGTNEPIPTTFKLAQNYPNPFNPGTTIRYELPEAATVSLTVYNLLGQRVRTLVDNEARGEGVFDRDWDGRNDAGLNAATGVYIYRLEAGNFRQSRKMLLTR